MKVWVGEEMKAWVFTAVMVVAVAYIVYDQLTTKEPPELTNGVPDKAVAFARKANQGQTFDKDCLEFGGQPNKMEVELLRELKRMRLPEDKGGYNILVADTSLFVGYGWQTSEGTGPLMFCEFIR